MTEVFKLANLLHSWPNLLSPYLKAQKLPDNVTLLRAVFLPNVTKRAAELTPLFFATYGSVPCVSTQSR